MLQFARFADHHGRGEARALPFIIASEYPCSVKAIPGTIQDGGAAFKTTQWSVVAACACENETADAALAARSPSRAAICLDKLFMRPKSALVSLALLRLRDILRCHRRHISRYPL